MGGNGAVGDVLACACRAVCPVPCCCVAEAPGVIQFMEGLVGKSEVGGVDGGGRSGIKEDCQRGDSCDSGGNEVWGKGACGGGEGLYGTKARSYGIGGIWAEVVCGAAGER